MTAATDYPSALFGLLAVIAISGAGGILFSRRRLTCVASWVLCSAAVSGFCLLLDLHFLAAVQFAANLYPAGIILATGGSERSAPAHDTTSPLRLGRPLWYMAGGVILGGVAWFLATRSQAIAQEMLGEPTLNSLPIWATRGDHISALGQELTSRHSIILTLLGLLILAGIASVAYVHRSRYRPREGDE